MPQLPLLNALGLSASANGGSKQSSLCAQQVNDTVWAELETLLASSATGAAGRPSASRTRNGATTQRRRLIVDRPHQPGLFYHRDLLGCGRDTSVRFSRDPGVVDGRLTGTGCCQPGGEWIRRGPSGA